MSKLLIEESPLTFQPSLAVAIGLNEAIVLQQVQYWITNPKNTGYEQDGYKWVYNTYKDWKTENFPFWSEATIKRTFLSLEEKGLLISIQPMKNTYDREKYYRINYKQLDTFDGVNLTRSMESKRPILHYTETTSENNFNDDATHHPQQQPQSSEKKKPKSRPKPSRPEFETEPEVFLHQRLVKHYSGLGFVAPVAWQNATQQETFVAYASKMSRNELDAFITWYLNNNKYKLSEIANGITTWGSKKKPAQQKETLREKWEREGRI